MKKATIMLILFMSIFYCMQAQTLFTDENGVLVYCKIQQTNKTTLCEGDSNADKKINIWKVTLSIENGHSESIVPRGTGIANISIYPIPIQPYSYEYCNYKYVDNFEPNSFQRHLDQSLYEWPIQSHKVEEIKTGEVIKNTTYLYLYEGQKPKLTNWEFLGYRLKDDFDTNDPILIDMATDSISSKPKVIVYRDATVNEKDIKNKEAKEASVAPVNTEEQIEEESVEPAFERKEEKEEILVIEKPIVAPITPVNVEEHLKEEINIGATLDNKKDTETIAVDEKPKAVLVTPTNIEEQIKKDGVEPTFESSEEKEEIAIVEKHEEVEVKTTKKIKDCSGGKSLEYKKMSDASSDKEEQKAYSWLALYYSYLCKCESGTQDNDLVAVINNVVDSFMYNTKGKYGKISKVKKCKAPVIE